MWCILQRMCLHWTNTPRSKPVRYLWNSSINLITEWFSVWVTRNSFFKNHCLISKIDFCSCWTFLTDLLLHCTGLTAWTDTQTLLFLVPYSDCALYRMNVSSWVSLMHQHNRACVSICFGSVYFHSISEERWTKLCSADGSPRWSDEGWQLFGTSRWCLWSVCVTLCSREAQCLKTAVCICIFCALTLVKCWKRFSPSKSDFKEGKQLLRRTQALSICRKTKSKLFIMISVIYFALSAKYHEKHE